MSCTPFQGISHFSFFSLHGGLQHITRPSGYISFLSVLKLCIKLHLADTVYTVLYFCIHTKEIFIIFIFNLSFQVSSFNSYRVSMLFLCCRNDINICNYCCLLFCCQLSSNLRTTPTVLSAWENYITMNFIAQSNSKCLHILPILRQHNDWST